MIKHYLVTTEHLENTLWFRDEEDFKVAMNYIALLAANHPEVIILAFILMSNHVHFVLKGKQKDILCFINKFKGLYSQYMRRKYGTKDFLRRNKVHLKEIGNNPEALERSIAYVQMNSVAANICSNPTQYPWGTGNTFFNPSYPEGKLLKSFSKRALKRILHSDCDTLPKDWLLLSAGYILPKSYVDFRTVESCYHTPKRMNYFNTISSKAKKRIDSGEAVLPTFKDQTIKNFIPEICRVYFNDRSYGDLLLEEQSEVLRQVRFRFSADAHQIARVFGLSYAQAARMLDSE